jgi:hypothetical protein
MADKNSIREAENSVRDLKNWIFVLGREHGLPEDALQELHKRVDEVAAKIAKIK